MPGFSNYTQQFLQQQLSTLQFKSNTEKNGAERMVKYGLNPANTSSYIRELYHLLQAQPIGVRTHMQDGCAEIPAHARSSVKEVQHAWTKALKDAQHIEIKPEHAIALAKKAISGTSGGLAGFCPKMLAQAILTDRSKALAQSYA